MTDLASSSSLENEAFRVLEHHQQLPWRLYHYWQRSPALCCGICFLIVLTCMAICAPVIAPYSPTALDPSIRLQGPRAAHWFGTNSLGQDVLSRVLYGGRVSLFVGVAVSALSSVVGSFIGLCAGWFRHADLVLMRVMDGFMAFPGLLLAFALSSVLGHHLWPVICILAVIQVPDTARLMRSCVLSLRSSLYVEAAQSIGVDDWRIMLRYVLPNASAPLIVQATLYFAGAVLAEAALSFLGTGVPITTPTWGNIIGQGQAVIQRAPWLSIFPGGAIALTVLAISVVGDGLRDILDPTLTHRG